MHTRDRVKDTNLTKDQLPSHGALGVHWNVEHSLYFKITLNQTKKKSAINVKFILLSFRLSITIHLKRENNTVGLLSRTVGVG